MKIPAPPGIRLGSTGLTPAVEIDVVLERFEVYRSGAKVSMRCNACLQPLPFARCTLRALVESAAAHQRTCRGPS